MPLKPDLTKLVTRLPLMAALGAFVCTLGVAGLAIHVATVALDDASARSFQTIASYRAEIVADYLKKRGTEVTVLADQTATVNALLSFDTGASQADEKDFSSLQAHYTLANPQPAENRKAYNGDNDRSLYGTAHRSKHPQFRKLLEDLDLYDLFLIRPDGTVIYTVEKEADFGTNLLTGPYRESGLGKAFRQAVDGARSRAVVFSDFTPYAPSGNAPAAFLARALVSDSNEVLGVLAVQVSISRLSQVMQPRADEQIDVMLVGQDRRLRSQLRRVTENTLLVRSVEGQHIDQALRGQPSLANAMDALGNRALVAAAPLNVFGQPFTVVASRPLDEVRAPVHTMTLEIISIASLLLVGVILFSAWLARRVTQPITQLSNAVSALADGQTIAIPGLDRKDEIGDLSRALRVVHETGAEAKRIRAALDKARVNVLVADTTDKYVYANAAAQRYFHEVADNIRRANPDFQPDAVVGCSREAMRRYLNASGKQPADKTRGYETRTTFGDRTIDLYAAPILNGQNEYLGATIEWRDVTDELVVASDVARVVRAASAGDFTQRVPVDGKAGVMREIADGVNDISEVVQNATAGIGWALQSLADGDLTYRMTGDMVGAFAELQNNLTATFDKLTETVSTIQTTAEEVANAAAEINAGSNDLARRTESQATSLEETAATTEELAASVKQTAESSRRAADLADEAKGVAGRGGEIATQAVDAIGRIEKASQRIAEIIGVIDDIAFQTNLLALNAAVEAARAGEAGKGFAVVASEVRTLAQRSGQAAKDIKSLIASSNEQVAEGVKLVHGAGDALLRIVEAANRVASTVVDISSATAEQANGIEEMSQTVAHLDEMTQQNSAMAEESAASAEGLQRQIEQLRDLVGTFKTARSAAGAMEVRGAAEPKLLQKLVRDAFAETAATPAARPARDTAAKAGKPKADDGWSARPQPQPQRRAAGGGDWSEF
jgi:methyl-accepting chemotaxis protein